MKKISYLLLLMATVSFKNSEKESLETLDSSPLPSDKTTWWQPVAGVTFDWNLDDLTVADSFTAEVVDVDAFTTSAEQVAALHKQGKKVIAYLSVGTIENDRPDLGLLPKDVLGKTYPEWPNEKWIDIRQIDKLKPWLNSRFHMIVAKGFDAIEPDNLDSYSNDTGFDIQLTDVQHYCDYLITLAHQNGLGIGQKNVPELTLSYRDKFDWVLTEDAFTQGWEEEVKGYIELNKPVFAVEYTDEISRSRFQKKICPRSHELGYTSILKKRRLNSWVYSCR